MTATREDFRAWEREYGDRDLERWQERDRLRRASRRRVRWDILAVWIISAALSIPLYAGLFIGLRAIVRSFL